MTHENQERVFNDLRELQIPTKASFFAWRLIRNKLPTKTNLRRRNVEINQYVTGFMDTGSKKVFCEHYYLL